MPWPFLHWSNRTMLSKIRQTLGLKSAVEKEAEAIWAKGEFLVDWRTPTLGQKWDEKYLPFFRQWAGENDNKTRVMFYCSSYGSIDDQEFWKRASSRFDESKYYTWALTDAAGRGNLEIFKAFPQKYVQEYIDMYKTPRQTSHGRRLVHPNVVAMMREQGHWGQADIDAMVADYGFLDDKTPSIKAFDGDGRGAYTKDFLQDWCVKVLRDYGWSADNQAQFLGHMMTTLNGSVWLDNAEVLKPLLHPDLDVALLAGVIGFSPKAYGDVAEHEGIELLYKSVQQVSQHCRQHVWKSGSPPAAPPLAIEGGHPGLNILMELSTPEQPMHLYRAAMMVKERELGFVKNETFALPALS